MAINRASERAAVRLVTAAALEHGPGVKFTHLVDLVDADGGGPRFGAVGAYVDAAGAAHTFTSTYLSPHWPAPDEPAAEVALDPAPHPQWVVSVPIEAISLADGGAAAKVGVVDVDREVRLAPELVARLDAAPDHSTFHLKGRVFHKVRAGLAVQQLRLEPGVDALTTASIRVLWKA